VSPVEHALQRSALIGTAALLRLRPEKRDLRPDPSRPPGRRVGSSAATASVCSGRPAMGRPRFS
jgi:hypothetical protein